MAEKTPIQKGAAGLGQPDPSRSPKPGATPKPTPSPSANAGPMTSGSYGSSSTSGAFSNTDQTGVVTDPNTGQSVSANTTIPLKVKGKVVPTTIGKLVTESRDPKKLASIRTQLINAGVLPKTTKSITSVQNAWIQVLIGSQMSQQDPLDYMSNLKNYGFGQETGAAGITPLQSSTRLTSAEDAKAKIVDTFKSLLNREPTADEVAAATKALNADEKKNPTKTVTTRDSKGNISYNTTGGTNIDQFLTDYINSKFASEASAIKTQSPDVTQVAKDKAIFDKAIAAAGGNLDKINAAKQNTTYGRNLTELETQINDQVLNAGATNDPGEVSQIAKYILDRGLDPRSETAKSYIESQLKYGKNQVSVGGKTTDMYTGTAGQNVDALNKVALANGLSLDQVFDPATLPEVLSAVSKGESLDTYSKIIRDAAKVAWNVSDNVGKLMDQGVSLNAIYQPYKNTMASTLELNPNDVTLNDLAKFGIVGQPTPGQETPKNLYDFQKALRKDDRWQYTAQAHNEVGNAVQKVLQDFGFMG